jgi:phenylalanine ammonia-lyase
MNSTAPSHRHQTGSGDHASVDKGRDAEAEGSVCLRGTGLSIDDLMRVARGCCPVGLSLDPAVHERIARAHAAIQRAVANNEVIYGVTTGFGGMAHVLMTPDEHDALQDNMLWYHKAGAGGQLPIADVRAAMVLRANSHLRGASGPRPELIERLLVFVNAGVTPCVPELGSIGASGDLIPLTYIAGALVGHDAGYRVDFNGTEMDAVEALDRLQLPRLRLLPKEALAMLNGTSVCTAIAAGCIHDARQLVALALHAHALMLQGLYATDLSFDSFIHDHKPHSGQIWVAAQLRALLRDSKLVRQADGRRRNPTQGLVQDRYSLRCLPQFMGPIVDGVAEAASQIEVEMNSTTDNPLIDAESGDIFYGGNFLAQYTGMAMDRLRHCLGLMATHLDVQIAQLVAPEFNNGLPPCLIGNRSRRVNMGLKGLQLAANSIAPLVAFFGNSLTDRFPSHAEQFNQNVNSQAFGSANLARQSIELLRQHVAISLLFGLQAVDLRAQVIEGHYDARRLLPPRMVPFYETLRDITATPPSEARPWLWNDHERSLDRDVAELIAELCTGGRLDRFGHLELPLRQAA